MVTITKRLEWDSAHRVLRHESKCGTLHGHRYAAEIEVAADALDSVGRVVDFGVVKQKVGAWIDEHWDHTTLVNSDDIMLHSFCETEHESRGKRPPYVFRCEPTAENIAIELYNVAGKLLDGAGVRVIAVTIYETPTARARYAGEAS